MKLLVAWGTASCLLTLQAAALAGDPAAARAQLKKGYELKQAGHCDQAIPFFVESERLDPQAKALLNLADCEERMGYLVQSQQHTLEARDLARRQHDVEMLAVAEQRVTELEKKMPKLTIQLAGSAPDGARVERDGTSLGAVSLGIGLPTNPGRHIVTVRAPGRAEKQYEITLSEGTAQTLVVEPGEKLEEPAPPPPPPPPLSPLPPPAPVDRETAAPARAASTPTGTWSTRKTAAVLLGGVGLSGVVVGSVFGLDAIAKNNDSNANGRCDPTGCDPTGKLLRNDALSEATVSTVAFVAGVACLAGGAVLYLTGDSKGAAARLALRPGGLSLAGRW